MRFSLKNAYCFFLANKTSAVPVNKTSAATLELGVLQVRSSLCRLRWVTAYCLVGASNSNIETSTVSSPSIQYS